MRLPGISHIADTIFPGLGSGLSGMFHSLTPNVGDGGAAAMRQQEEERRARVAEATQKINALFDQGQPGAEGVPATPGFNDDYFKNIADSFVKFQHPLFEEQLAKARRELPYQFASTDSAEYIRKKADLERDAAREAAQIQDQGADFSNKQRAQVEQNRGELVSMATAGADANTLAQMSNARAQALAKPPLFTPIADLFQKYTAAAANNPTLIGVPNGGYGYGANRQLLYPSTYGGGGVSGAVRNIGD